MTHRGGIHYQNYDEKSIRQSEKILIWSNIGPRFTKRMENRSSIFHFLFNEKYTKNSTLCFFMKERLSAF